VYLLSYLVRGADSDPAGKVLESPGGRIAS